MELVYGSYGNFGLCCNTYMLSGAGFFLPSLPHPKPSLLGFVIIYHSRWLEHLVGTQKRAQAVSCRNTPKLGKLKTLLRTNFELAHLVCNTSPFILEQLQVRPLTRCFRNTPGSVSYVYLSKS
jgi:hypothetical protein